MSNQMFSAAVLGDVIATLVSYEEIAELLAVQKATVWKWRSLGTLPEPAGTIGGRPVWTREVISEWAQQTGRTIHY